MSKPKSPAVKVTFWHMLRDVLIASLNKGQFLVALSFLVVIIILLKMPGQDVSRLAFEVVQKLENGRLLGYLMTILISGGWFTHAKWQRRRIATELTRLADERNKLQKKSITGKVTSSGTRRMTKGK